MLHGWPGDRRDWSAVLRLLPAGVRSVVPDLYGFGGTGWDVDAPIAAFSAEGQAAKVIELIESLGLRNVVVAGYDIGSRVAQRIAAARPDLVAGLVVGPPLPGAGERVLEPARASQFWYQTFHQLEVSTDVIDGSREAVGAYLAHFWRVWSGPRFEPDAALLERLIDDYSRPGAFRASVSWYRAGSGTVAAALRESPPAPSDRITVRASVLWPDKDPLFPLEWADDLAAWFTRATVRPVDAGHFLPLEAPAEVCAAIVERLTAE